MTVGSDRFRLWDKPLAYPNFDIVNRAPEGPVFDMGVDLDGYDGSVYVHADHVREMARSLGMLSTEEADSLRARIADLENQISNLPDALEEFKNGIDSHIGEFHRNLRRERISDLGAGEAAKESANSDKPAPKAERKAGGPFSV